MAVGVAWGSGVAVGVTVRVATGFFAAGGFDAGALPFTFDDAVWCFPGVAAAGCWAAPGGAATTCTMTAAAGDVDENEDAEAQPVSIKIELTDTQDRRSCRIWW